MPATMALDQLDVLHGHIRLVITGASKLEPERSQEW